MHCGEIWDLAQVYLEAETSDSGSDPPGLLVLVPGRNYTAMYLTGNAGQDLLKQRCSLICYMSHLIDILIPLFSV